MTTLTFQLSAEQLNDPLVLQKLQEFSDVLKPKVPTPEELESARDKRFKSKKFMCKAIASFINVQVEKFTGKKLGVNDKAIFELMEISEGQQDISKIMLTWMLPMSALFSAASPTSSSSSVPRTRSGPSLYRRNESSTSPQSTTLPQEENSQSGGPSPDFAINMLTTMVNMIAPAFDTTDMSSSTAPQSLADMVGALGQQLGQATQQMNNSGLPTNPTFDQFLGSLFGNMSQPSEPQ